MLTSAAGARPIPYGIDAGALPRLLAAGAEGAGLSLALARSGHVLRINDPGLALPPPSVGEPEASTAERVAAYLTRLAGAWNAPGARFLERYFAFLHHQIAANRTEIAAKLAPFEGLFAPEDFLFSAPLPLPRAFLPAPSQAHEGMPTAEDHVQVDFAFWLGDAPTALLASPSSLTPGAARRRDERLAAAGTRIVPYRAAELSGEGFGLFERVLGAEACRFWADEPLPCAPAVRGLPGF